MVDEQLELNSDEFSVVESSPNEVEFLDEESGIEKAVALAEQNEGAWVVTSFSACNEFLKDEQAANSEGGQN